MGYYCDIPLDRQKEILTRASIPRIRRLHLDEFHCKKADEMISCLTRKKELTEMQRFFLKGIEERLLCRNRIKPYISI